MTENLVLQSRRSCLLSIWWRAALPDRAVKEKVQSALSAHVPGPVGRVAQKMLDVGAVRVAVQPSSGLPPLPVALQKHLGVPEELLRGSLPAPAGSWFPAHLGRRGGRPCMSRLRVRVRLRWPPR